MNASPPTRPRLLLEVVVFCVGMASLGAEIAAARLLAPWFGASTIVWANTIATVLVALSIGYAIGGRLADRNPTMAGLSRWVRGRRGAARPGAVRQRPVPPGLGDRVRRAVGRAVRRARCSASAC